MADYPLALPVLTDEVGLAAEPLNAPSLPAWALHISQEVEAIAAELGLSPSAAFSTVTARFADIDSQLGALPGAYVPQDLSTLTASSAPDSDDLVYVWLDGAPRKVTLADVLALATGGGFTQEQIEDFVGALIQDNSVLDFTYDDTAGSIVATIKAGAVTAAMVAADVATQAELDAVSAAIPSTEAIQDVVGALVADSVTLDATYNDAGAIESFEALVIGDWTDLGNLGATETIVGVDGVFVRRLGTLDQACAITLTLSNDQQIDLMVTQDATGGRAVTFVGVDAWFTFGGAAPDTSRRAALTTDRFRFEKVNGTVRGYWVSAPIIETHQFALSDESTALTTGTKLTTRWPYDFIVTAVRANVNTVSSSGIPTVDINEGGTTILSTKLTIDANEKTSTTAATAPVISDPVLANDAEITFDIDVAGTGTKGLKVIITGYRP